ncbi:(Fe-S)-binding protein [Candidatus Alkanophaga liquidiphilum]
MMIEEHIKKLHRCFRCGFCKFTSNFTDLNCPSYMRFRFETYSTGGRLWLIRAWLSGEVEWTKHLAEIIYACTTCRNCVEQCVFGFSDDIVNMIVAARSEAVEQGLVPPIVRDFLNNISKHGNPWGKARSKRAAGLKGVRKYGQQQEYLYYVGCIGSYDERAQVVAKSLAELLEMAGVAFGILGEDEDCDGNEVYRLGEIGLFQLLAERNINKFKELGVKKIVTLSHSHRQGSPLIYQGEELAKIIYIFDPYLNTGAESGEGRCQGSKAQHAAFIKEERTLVIRVI